MNNQDLEHISKLIDEKCRKWLHGMGLQAVISQRVLDVLRVKDEYDDYSQKIHAALEKIIDERIKVLVEEKG